MPINLYSRPARLPHTALAAYAIALIAGTLYPWSGWRATGIPVFGFILEPWPRWWTWFDVLINIAVYLPGGMLLAMVLRQRHTAARAILLSVLICSTVAFVLEALQSLLPNRVPSQLDWMANTAGAALGSLFYPWGQGLATRSQRALDQRIAIGGTDSAIAAILLGVWLLIQWPPQRLLFGHGNLLGSLTGLIQFAGLDLAIANWRMAPTHTVFAEAFGVTMAVIGIGLLVREVLPTHAPRAAITAGLLMIGLVVKTVAGATMLGPDKALGWLTAGAQGGLLIGAVLLALLSAARRVTRLRLTIAALALSGLLTTAFPFDAYYATAFAGWHSGSWRNIDGLLRGAATLWPYATIAWCAWRLRALNRQRWRMRGPL